MKINGFQKGHLLKWQFYWLFWAALSYRVSGYPKSISDGVSYIGVGPAYPNEQLWDDDYSVGMIGKIFGAVVLHYTPRQRGIINPFSLAVPIHKWEKTATEEMLTI